MASISASAAGPSSDTSANQVPIGFKLHTENTASILLPDTADTFLNPVQEFNRDLSVACIRVWSEDLNSKKKEKWLSKTKSKGKSKGKRAAVDDAVTDDRAIKKPKGEPLRTELRIISHI